MDMSAAQRRIDAQCNGTKVYKHLPTGKRHYLGKLVGNEFELIPISGPTIWATAEELQSLDVWERQ